MRSPAELLAFAKSNKKIIFRYLYGNSDRCPAVLKQLRKHELSALLFLTIESPAELCRFLHTPFFQLENIINHPSYERYTIRKKKGGHRQILEPEEQLKHIQKCLNYSLQAYYLCVKPNQVHGFVVNPHYLGTQCNIVENAKAHTGKKQVLNIDLKDFFPTITAKQVKHVFTSSFFNFSEELANAFTLLTTYEGNLPIGAPTSPVISNFVCYKLDSDLIHYCKINHLTYTRYADDLTFSSDSDITPYNTLEIINLIHKNNFEINEKKLRKQSCNRRQSVTGLTVNEMVNVDRRLLKKIRAMLHDLTRSGMLAAAQRHFKMAWESEAQLKMMFMYRLRGYINFVGQVRGKSDALFLRLKSSYENVVRTTDQV